MAERADGGVGGRGQRITALPALVDFVLNQLAWWWCVLSALSGRGALCFFAVLAYVGAHGVASGQPGPIVLLGLCGAMVGLLADTILLRAELLAFPTEPEATESPLFMISIWGMFAISLASSARPLLRQRPWLQSLVGAAAGPLAYTGGERIGVIELESTSLLAIGLEWAVLIPLLAWITQRIEQRRELCSSWGSGQHP